MKGAGNLPSPFWVLADKHYVGQVLVNLIINSIHYGREGGTTNVRFRDMLDRIERAVDHRHGLPRGRYGQPRRCGGSAHRSVALFRAATGCPISGRSTGS